MTFMHLLIVVPHLPKYDLDPDNKVRVFGEGKLIFNFKEGHEL